MQLEDGIVHHAGQDADGSDSCPSAAPANSDALINRFRWTHMPQWRGKRSSVDKCALFGPAVHAAARCCFCVGQAHIRLAKHVSFCNRINMFTISCTTPYGRSVFCRQNTVLLVSSACSPLLRLWLVCLLPRLRTAWNSYQLK